MATDRSPQIVRDALIVGFAMFAVFFGAGNLIFPPQIGFLAGAGWGSALFGLLLTGMLLPVLSVVALGLCGGSVERLTAPVASWFGSVLLFFTMLGLIWLIAVPRTGSVAFETGFMTLAPALDRGLAALIFMPVFFAATAGLALDRSNVVDTIGRYLTPVLLGLLGIIVVWSVLSPLGTPAVTAEAAPFRLGLVTGYQTGDVFGGLIFGIIFIEAIRGRGYTEGTGFTRVLCGASAVTFLGLLFVYGGLEYLGATGSGVLGGEVSQSGLLTSLVGQLAGTIGANALAVAVLLACLTTAVGATTVIGEYVEKWSGGRVSYRAGVILVVLSSMALAFGGVDFIVGLAGPLFALFYPVGICLVILGLLSRLAPGLLNDGAWKGTTVAALLMGSFDVAISLSGQLGFALPEGTSGLYEAIPLAPLGFAWALPAAAGGLAGAALWRMARGRAAAV